MSNHLKRAALAATPLESAAKRIKTAVSAGLSLLSRLTKAHPHFQSVSSSEFDLISSLPLELLQKIFAFLSPASYVAIKFVSKNFHAATFTSSGKDIRGWLGTKDGRSLFEDPYRSLRDGVLAEEATHPTALTLLTCWSCGRRKPNGIDGFCDQQFDQGQPDRRCIECRYPRGTYPSWYGIPTPIWIHNVAVQRCFWCKKLCLLDSRVAADAMEVVPHRCLPSMMVRGWWAVAEAEMCVEAMDRRMGAKEWKVEDSETGGWINGVGHLFSTCRRWREGY